ncbi:MAG TPA: hypothetical protein VGH89_22240 [Pseudonocardia sp.]|jgi:hypothetical protein
MSSTSRRGELAARAAAVAGAVSAVGTAAATAGPVGGGAEHAPRPTEGRVPRTRPVRVTVELSPMEHKALRQWCASTAAELDLPVVAGAEVFRALLALMRDSPEMADAVRAELERTGGSRRRH